MFRDLTVSKVVFFMLEATACGAFLMGKMEVKDFMILAIAASTFYFATPKTTNDTPVGGK